eukprot:6128342-Pyramimonas_sp.AAC.1
MEELFLGKRFYVARQRAELSLSWRAILKFTATGFDEPPTLEWATSDTAALDIDRRAREGSAKALFAAKALQFLIRLQWIQGLHHVCQLERSGPISS